MFAIPPMLSTVRFSAGVRNRASWKRWDQRCALTANRHVAPPEVGDGVDAGDLGDQVRITDLKRKGVAPPVRCRTVCPWLPIAAMSSLRSERSASKATIDSPIRTPKRWSASPSESSPVTFPDPRSFN